MSDLHKEINFEVEICEHLAANGWLYRQGDAASYDRTRALFPEDVLAWVKATQPKAWEVLEKNHGAQAGEVLLGRLRDSINQRGTLDVLRHGIELIGLRQPVTLAQFKPALAINPDILTRYAANRLRVVRQLRYSLYNENALDLGLFLNGIPVATAELKTDFTQSVDDAIDQYRFDREPRPKSQGNPEPLLSFPNGALVHFAVSNSEVYMTTLLEGAATRFLPFNRGNNGGAGNPPYTPSPSPQPSPVEGEGAIIPLVPSGIGEDECAITPHAPSGRGEGAISSPATSGRGQGEGAILRLAPSGRGEGVETITPLAPSGRGAGGEGDRYGHRTAYLWEDIWARDSWLEILGRYLVAQKDRKNRIKKIIFPRFHQLDGTRKLLAAVLQEGAGGKYLIQHSAGSGKTNSIAWSAHFLADLHTAAHEKLFDTVLVVSDRNVLDSQLQEAIFDFERTAGVVATIKGESASKSGELATALSGGKKIVVCTIQTFPFALKTVQEQAATHGKCFAVIADEAHSSQTGEAAAKLKAVLSAEELQALSDGGEVSTEDLLAAQMANRSAESGITYVAFTATPKAKTLELFGRRPRPDLPAGADNTPAPFHVYSMRQAIEEGFILDVLKNYTPYKLAFKLAHDGKELDDKEVERSEALKGIMRWVRLHPYNISQKVQVVVEHFRENVAPLLNGKGKAMVVVGSRLEAVRWRLAIAKYIKENGYTIGTLVAFSGEVNDPQSGADPFSETCHAMNPNLKGQDIREAFATADYQILLVANKFQTGFDQPLLCGMYVDKRLAGIAAVQTLSRLNRAYPGKDTTYVVDFINEPEDILAAFKTYYETAELSNVTDPHLVFDLRMKLDAAGFYDEFEVNRVVDVEFNPNAKQSELAGALEPVVSRLLLRYKAAQETLNSAKAKEDGKAEADAQNELDALVLFKHDMAAFQRMYAFLSQIFDYGNTAIEKRFIFYRRLLPLLEFGREREGIDLSKVILTHHSLKRGGKRDLPLVAGDYPKLPPMSDAGTGGVQEKQTAYLLDIIAKINELFEGDLTDNDSLQFVRTVEGKMLESEILVKQAANNTKEQFANSPDLMNELMNAIIDAFAAHSTMSKQALDSEHVRKSFLDILLGPGQLYEDLRKRAQAGGIGG